MPSRRENWNIFCTVVDNFGDIGVTWRIVKELEGKGKKVKLFLDKIEVLSMLEESIKPDADTQKYSNSVTVIKWDEQTCFETEADVLIEMFACNIPDRYVSMMTDNCLWINVEYLTAEDWVDDCHGLCSMDRGHNKYFFFPGFTDKTGGINFEVSIRTDEYKYSVFVDRLFETIEKVTGNVQSKPLIFSAFTYENKVMAETICRYKFNYDLCPVFIVPEGLLLKFILEKHGADMSLYETFNICNRTVKLYNTASESKILTIPMLSQNDYDEILRRCDLNFVRGEDSFIRAQLAAKPFIWNIYPQDEQYHMVKLDAFIKKYTSEFPVNIKNAYIELSRGFNNEDLTTLQQYFKQILYGLSTISQPIIKWRNSLINRGSLTENLIEFAENH